MATIVVTGASTGIGEACTLRLARAGHRVIAGVRRDEDGVRLAAQHESVVPVLLDVTDQGQIEEAHTAMRAAAEGSRNPFTLIAMADVEMLHGNLDEARQYLRRARWWYSGEPEVYEAMSRLARLEEQHEKADKYLAKASALRQRGQVEVDSLN